MKDPLKELEDWVSGAKGRYVHEISIDTGYCATCWEVVIGNSDKQAGEGWTFGSTWGEQHNKAEVCASATSFLEGGNIPPNVVYARDDDDMDWFPGLGETILAALIKAEELGL